MNRLVLFERRLRRLAGRRHASDVAAELKSHVEEAVAEGSDRDEALSDLGELRAREFVPRDGAPRWFDRRNRVLLAFWATAVCTLVYTVLAGFVRLFNVSFASAATVAIGVFFSAAAVMAVAGYFGARWLVVPSLLGAVATIVPLSVYTSVIGVYVWTDHGYHGQPRGDAEALAKSIPRSRIAREGTLKQRAAQSAYFLSPERPIKSADGQSERPASSYVKPVVLHGGAASQFILTGSLEEAITAWRTVGRQAMALERERYREAESLEAQTELALKRGWPDNFVLSLKSCALIAMFGLTWALSAAALGSIAEGIVTGLRVGWRRLTAQ